jgi:hypothetical protein
MNDWFPSARYRDDFLVPLKFMNKLDVLGFTLNPLWSEGANLTQLRVEVPNMKVSMRGGC